MTDGSSERDIALCKIWADDKLDRRSEAEALQAYIESVGSLPLGGLERTLSHTIALDAQYGFGKSFFLSRFSKQLSLTHPVIYINAWEDDFDDEPLIALAAGLKEVIEPILAKGAKNKEGLKAFDALMGAFRHLIPHIVPIAAGVLGYIIPGADKIVEAGGGVLKSTGSETDDILNARIVNFQNGRKQIQSVKIQLGKMTEAIVRLGDENTTIPLIIIIDELDRCRPTYALKLLEHVKHLFDVSGIFFIFGMHGDQLSHSVAGAYGAGFDGKDYLRRFINRRFTLENPSTDKIMAQFFDEMFSSADQCRMQFPDAFQWKGSPKKLTLSEIVGRYLNEYQLAPRDIFSVFDIMKTSLSMTGDSDLQLAYFLPLVVAHVQGFDQPRSSVVSDVDRGWHFSFRKDDRTPPVQLFKQFQHAARLSAGDLHDRAEAKDANDAERICYVTAKSKSHKFAKLVNYKRLVNIVGIVPYQSDDDLGEI